MPKTVYYCEHCNREFSNEQTCKNHETNCATIYKFKCDKCGKVITYSNKLTQEDMVNKNQCHVMFVYSPGYGSNLDSCNVKYNLCDDCLTENVKVLSEEAQDRIYGY